jgi:protein SCO1
MALPLSLVRRHLLLVGMAAALAACGPPKPQLTNFDITGAAYGTGFSLRDPAGRVRTLADFKGRAVLVFFGFTQCPSVCPTALVRAVEVRRLLGARANRLQVLFVTLDPERDEPALLKAYTEAFDPSFLGLSTDVARTAAVAESFKVFYRKVPTGGSYTMDHTATSYLYDPQGRLRVAIPHEATAESVAHDVSLLLDAPN